MVTPLLCQYVIKKNESISAFSCCVQGLQAAKTGLCRPHAVKMAAARPIMESPTRKVSFQIIYMPRHGALRHMSPLPVLPHPRRLMGKLWPLLSNAPLCIPKHRTNFTMLLLFFCTISCFVCIHRFSTIYFCPQKCTLSSNSLPHHLMSRVH